MSDGHVEILAGRERRRRWSAEAKLRIVSETEEPGACVKQVSHARAAARLCVKRWLLQ